MTTNKKTSESFYKQVKKKIIEKIQSGTYQPGEKIPSERELCEIYSVSRTTIRKAIDELEFNNVLHRQSGKGTFVKKVVENKSSTGNLLFLRCLHSDISKSSSEIKDDIFYPKVLTGFEIASSARSYNCILKIINENIFNEKELDKIIDDIDGIACAELHNERLLKYLIKTDLPVVIINPSLHTDIIDVIKIDNINGAISSVNHLIEAGHKDIAFIGGSSDSLSSIQREQGYIQALKNNNLKVNPSFNLSYGWRLEDGYKAAMDLIKNNSTPTAIFTASDLLAIGAINAIKDSGKSIPGDISIIGFDDIDMASQIKPALTTTYVNKVAMGKEAANRLFKLISEGREYPLKIVIPGILKKRETVLAKNG